MLRGVPRQNHGVVPETEVFERRVLAQTIDEAQKRLILHEHGEMYEVGTRIFGCTFAVGGELVGYRMLLAKEAVHVCHCQSIGAHFLTDLNVVKTHELTFELAGRFQSKSPMQL